MSVFGPVNGDIFPIDVRKWLRLVTVKFQSSRNCVTFVMDELAAKMVIDDMRRSTLRHVTNFSSVSDPSFTSAKGDVSLD
jgi:hypothetical protein